ncbi:hypothetical protein [Ensifer canadensis]
MRTIFFCFLRLMLRQEQARGMVAPAICVVVTFFIMILYAALVEYLEEITAISQDTIIMATYFLNIPLLIAGFSSFALLFNAWCVLITGKPLFGTEADSLREKMRRTAKI